MLTTDELDVSGLWPGRRRRPVPSPVRRELAGGWTSTLLALAKETGDDLVLRLMTREPGAPTGLA